MKTTRWKVKIFSQFFNSVKWNRLKTCRSDHICTAYHDAGNFSTPKGMLWWRVLVKKSFWIFKKTLYDLCFPPLIHTKTSKAKSNSIICERKLVSASAVWSFYKKEKSSEEKRFLSVKSGTFFLTKSQKIKREIETEIVIVLSNNN